MTVRSASGQPPATVPGVAAPPLIPQQPPQAPQEPPKVITFCIALCQRHASLPASGTTPEEARKFAVGIVSCTACGPGDPVYAAVVGTVQLLAAGHLTWEQLQAMVAEARRRMPPQPR